VPTYNERENVEKLCAQLLALPLAADVLFLDDNSPDGTGEVLDRLAEAHANVSVVHRPGKLGIGSAHQAGIAWAYAHGYQTLVTMDCDFTHNPADIERLLAESEGCAVAVGSRFLRKGSLPGWNPLRRALTWMGHFITRFFLGMPYDATGAFRVYRLARIPAEVFALVQAGGYSFFFESLFLLHRNGVGIREVGIVLPARTYGHSKMSFWQAARSAGQALRLGVLSRADAGRFRPLPAPPEIRPELVDPQGWDAYWQKKGNLGGVCYEIVASLYRRLIIRKNLSWILRRHFRPGASLLHAGCGGGQVDMDVQGEMKITAVDISPVALQHYRRNNPQAREVRHGSIFALPFGAETFAGAYNLGVMEHFTAGEIQAILRELRRVVRPNGKVVLFWPRQQGASVMFLGLVHWVFHHVLQKKIQLHPTEISLLGSRGHARSVLTGAGLELLEYHFGMRDFFCQAIVVGRRP